MCVDFCVLLYCQLFPVCSFIIAVQSTASVMECPNGCRLSMR